MTATLTPFEQSHNRAATLGVRLVESFAINNLITQAQSYESRMSEIGNGCPPLSETLHISLMWSQVGMFAEVEA